MSVVVRRYLGRSRLAEALVEDMPMAAYRNAIYAQDVDELVAECLDLAQISKKTWAYVLEKLFADNQADDIDDLDETGHAMKTACAKIADVFERVQEMVEKAAALGYPIQYSSDFMIARREVEKIKEDVEKKFPSVDIQTVKQSLECYKRGNYTSAEDLLRESQSQSS